MFGSRGQGLGKINEAGEPKSSSFIVWASSQKPRPSINDN